MSEETSKAAVHAPSTAWARWSTWAGIAALAAVAAIWIEDPSGHMRQGKGGGLLVVDVRSLIDAKAAQVGTLAMSDANAAATETQAFVDRLKGALKAYGDAGYTVLNAGYVAQWPEGADITPAVAKELGVDLAMAKAKQTPETVTAGPVSVPVVPANKGAAAGPNPTTTPDHERP